jgi:hypothetical protein
MQHGPSGARTLAGRLPRLVGERAAVSRPVFVLTHHEREPVEMAGARLAVRQALASGVRLTPVEVGASPHATHIRYRVTSAASGRP